PRVQKQAPNFLAGISSAGFARNHNRKSLLAQFLRKARELGALAAPIQSFKGDEFAAPQCHASIIPMKVIAGPRPSRGIIKSFLAKPWPRRSFEWDVIVMSLLATEQRRI